jgi:mRNA-degrading endonuclease toxin of MazEF toxin-antitoxin module
LQELNNLDSIEFSKWTKEKVTLKYKSQIPSFPIYNNFIYWCNLGINIGSEQNKLRPVLILKTSKNSPICTILPLTSKRLHDKFWFHIDLDEIDSTVLVEQLKVVSKLRIMEPFRKKGKLIAISQKDWNQINHQLENLYRLRPLKEE